MAKENPMAIPGGGGGARSGAGRVGKVTTKAVSTPTANSLKKIGIEKLKKINRTTSESDIMYALRQGKITQKEAAAINPAKFPLPDKTKTSVIGTIDSITGKITRGK